MGYHFREQENFVRIVELTPAMRKQIEATIEQLLLILDQFDGDPDLEDGADGEPSLSWTDTQGRYGLDDIVGAPFADPADDNELEDEHDEDGGDHEPTLGWTESGAMATTFEIDEREDDTDDEGESFL